MRPSLHNYQTGEHAQITMPSSTLPASPDYQGGLISEFVYSEEQPVLAHILLPLLHHLGAQSRWLLWLAPQQKLSRHWLRDSGLPVDKVVQLRTLPPASTVEAMARALQSGNYSVVLGWLPELTDAEHARLQQAAQRGQAYGFIMRPQLGERRACGHFPALKIHSSRYH
ncbi:cell division inhibitor SulA [Nissabacter sp. SGAir0207]|nr:cell division inhibitor SulA [Nissabacter sp. SGAir0207]